MEDTTKKQIIDREVKILKNGIWESAHLSQVKAGDKFRIYQTDFSTFVAGYENEFEIIEYEALTDASIGENDAWELDCIVWEEQISDRI